MTIIEAIILGIVQGLTEFLPISSTAHLTIVGRIMGAIDPAAPEEWTAFIATIQVGTLASVLWYFAGDLKKIISGMMRKRFASIKPGEDAEGMSAYLGWLVIVGTIPVVVIGLTFKNIIEGALTKNLLVLGATLIIFAIVLFIAERVAKQRRTMWEATVRDALIVGTAQAFALIPGASRSGTTITGALFAGFKRDEAARFSFLLSVPAIAASALLEFVSHLQSFSKPELLRTLAATIAAAVVGYFTIDYLLRFLRTRSTMGFIIYRIALGGALLGGIAMNFFQP